MTAKNFGIAAPAAMVVAAVLSVGAANSAASAQIVETEPNSSLATADFIDAMYYPYGAVAIDGTLTEGDVDFFSFSVNAGDYVVFSVFDLGTGSDGYLAVYDPSGALFGTDDDDSIGLMPAFDFVATTSGVWTFALTGFDDRNTFTGNHDENFAYKALFGINPLPTPGSVALLGAGGLLAARRRR